MPASFTLAQREAMQVAATWAGIRVRAFAFKPVSAFKRHLRHPSSFQCLPLPKTHSV